MGVITATEKKFIAYILPACYVIVTGVFFEVWSLNNVVDLNVTELFNLTMNTHTKGLAFGLLVASVFSATILPLATAFYICEAFGFEAGIDKTMKDAPEFYGLFTAIIIIGAAIILIPGAPLLQISLGSQVINGMLLPVVLICMMLMVNKKDLMGEYTNNKFKNCVGWITIVILIALTMVLLFQA